MASGTMGLVQAECCDMEARRPTVREALENKKQFDSCTFEGAL